MGSSSSLHLGFAPRTMRRTEEPRHESHRLRHFVFRIFVRPGSGEGPGRAQGLHEALRTEAKKHFDARRAELAKLKTPDDVRKRQEAIRAKFLESLGGFPEKTPLNAKVTGTLKADGYRVEKVVYESRPNHHVTGVAYVPDGKGPFPGVLIPCGHSANGKAAEAYQRVSILLAKHGFVVLCYDPIGQGERYQLLDRDGKPSIPSNTNEHTLIGIGAWLVGQSTATYRIWDGIRSIDYLASRPDVDAKKLGCAGNSGGGTLTAYLMALDDRIAAAVPSCYITSLEQLFATIGPQDAEQNILGQVAFGMEHADFALLRAPRPTLFAVATRDFFDIDGAWTAYREASKYYSILGHSERMAISEYDDTHGFTKPRREATLRWMRRWLQGVDDAPTEASFPVFKDADLRCTRSGQVLEDYQGISAYQMNAKFAAEMAPQREKFAKLTKAQQRDEVRRLLRLHEGKSESTLDQLAKSTTTRVPADIKLPIQQFDVVVHEGPVEAASQERFKEFEKSGRSFADFVFVSPRGMSMPAPTGKPRYFSHDFGESMLSLHLDRPCLENALPMCWRSSTAFRRRRLSD
ncbi:MAG: acetylxylan esterase [Gemmataceae bacterium]